MDVDSVEEKKEKRSTTTSRVTFSLTNFSLKPPPPPNAPPIEKPVQTKNRFGHIEARKWDRKLVRVAHMQLLKWVPREPIPPGKEYKGIAAKPKYMGDMPITRAAAAQIQQQPMRRERLETKRRASRAVSYKEAEEEFEFDLGSSSDEEERSRKKRKEAADSAKNSEQAFQEIVAGRPNVTLSSGYWIDFMRFEQHRSDNPGRVRKVKREVVRAPDAAAERDRARERERSPASDRDVEASPNGRRRDRERDRRPRSLSPRSSPRSSSPRPVASSRLHRERPASSDDERQALLASPERGSEVPPLPAKTASGNASEEHPAVPPKEGN